MIRSQPGCQIQVFGLTNIEGLIYLAQDLAGPGIGGQPDIEGFRFLQQTDFNVIFGVGAGYKMNRQQQNPQKQCQTGNTQRCAIRQDF